jgi:hypothetical protein
MLKKLLLVSAVICAAAWSGEAAFASGAGQSGVQASAALLLAQTHTGGQGGQGGGGHGQGGPPPNVTPGEHEDGEHEEGGHEPGDHEEGDHEEGGHEEGGHEEGGGHAGGPQGNQGGYQGGRDNSRLKGGYQSGGTIEDQIFRHDNANPAN